MLVFILLQAVDSGRRSGHGRVVYLYYELCEKIWGGSPATEKIKTGVETEDVNEQLVTGEGESERDDMEEDQELTLLSNTSSQPNNRESTTAEKIKAACLAANAGSSQTILWRLTSTRG